TPGDYRVEADASGASYFLALGAMTGGPVTVLGVGKNSIQGDVGFAQYLSEMGATVEMTQDSITVSRKEGQPLIGLELDCNAIPDAAMTFVPMALVTEGPIRLTGIGSWRVKETDRLTALATEMNKFGAIVEEGTDWLCIHKPGDKPTDAEIETYDDHRMAMSLSLAAVAGVNVTILDPDCTAKTFPTYFELLESLRCEK
ncbi:MAG: 3-phosphoshikimate 1-carboxyvinyltransferase, partial [Sutterellaceae bacterium]|nr:3-phosphoshikimate 1-carboxyvinyltransferase [Sutterellaceae bacterium]